MPEGSDIWIFGEVFGYYARYDDGNQHLIAVLVLCRGCHEIQLACVFVKLVNLALAVASIE